jgi:PAS domain S-box-containing protein
VQKKGTNDSLAESPNTGSNQNAADKTLAASELRYRRLFETARDGILILDAKTGIIVDVNQFLLDLLDYPYDDFVGKASTGFYQARSRRAERANRLRCRRHSFARRR